MPNQTGSVARKDPCRKCSKECTTGNAVICRFCGYWFHSACIKGISQEFVKCCDAINCYYNGYLILCGVCRKVTSMLNRNIKEMETKMSIMEADLATAALER